MADCYAPEMDDLHRRWLPREIFADIGIADAAGVHLTAGIFGGEAPPSSLYHQQRQAAQVCGFEGSVLAAYGGSRNGGGAPAAWPLSPYPTLQWQVATNFATGGGVPGGGPVMPAPAPLGPYYGPPPAKRRLGGTGVFLPRTEAYQYQHKATTTKPPAKDGESPKEGCEKTKLEDEQWQKVATTAAEKTTQQEFASAALLALPQEWTY